MTINLKRMTFVADDSKVVIEPSTNAKKHKVTIMEDGREPYVRYLSTNNKNVKKLFKTRGVMVFLG